MATRFEGKTVIVTGAGSGIGRATALRLVGEGATVVAADVDPDRLEALVDQTGEKSVRTVAGDLTDAATIGRIINATDGLIDCLANIAGIMDGFLPAGEVDDTTWDRVLSVNLTAPMRLTRAVLPTMIKAYEGGTIVNVSSEAGLRGSAAGAAYTSSKHALIGFTRHLAVFYATDGIRANAVAPGAVATDIKADFRSEAAGQRLGQYLQVAPPTAGPDQLAATITWLLSDDSDNVTGAVLPSDGGWSAI